MLNFVNRLFVGKSDGTVNSNSTIPTLVTGEIAFAGYKAGKLQILTDTELATLGDGEPMYVLQGTPDGNIRKSAPILRSEIRANSFRKEAYTPAAAQVSMLTPVVTGNTTTGTFKSAKHYRLIIQLETDLPMPSSRPVRAVIPFTLQSDYTGALGAAATTAGSVNNEIAKLVYRINKYPLLKNMIVASQIVGAGTNNDASSSHYAARLVLTGQTIPTEGPSDYEFVKFTASLVELAAGEVNETEGTLLGDAGKNLSVNTGVFIYTAGTVAATSVNVDAVGGSGMAVQVRAMERMARGHLGFTDNTSWDRAMPTSEVVDGIGYDIISLQLLSKYQGDLQGMREMPLQVTIATSTSGSAAQGIAVEKSLKSFVAGTLSTSSSTDTLLDAIAVSQDPDDL